MIYSVSEKSKTLPSFLSKYWLLLFFISELAYFELIYRLWNFKALGGDYIFPLLFAIPAGAVLFLLSGLFSERINRIVAAFLTVILTIVYYVQLIYFCIFHTPLPFYSLLGAGDVLQFWDIILEAVVDNLAALILQIVPIIVFLSMGKGFSFFRIGESVLWPTLIVLVEGIALFLISVNLTSKEGISQYTLYYEISAPELSVKKLGLLTTVRLDIARSFFGLDQNEGAHDEKQTEIISDDMAAVPSFEEFSDMTSETGGMDNTENPPESKPEEIEETKTFGPNVLNIDFETLIANEKDKELLDMHKYFSEAKPTNKNEYTGLFESDNLILITAEAFSPYVISQELTPTLYKMSTEGFVFNNFYNPIWGVSTSDGEYVACTGLIPKTGVWSMARSGKNFMPFAMGNQFRRLGYTTKAYHNHTYDYYKRDVSHPNLGYDYKGVGNGLEIKKTWPESDLEMIEVTAGEYIGTEPFHTYYMTVSGHMNYTFYGNTMARKNEEYVSKLPYSEASKAYIACNLELEFAMKALIEKLEEAGVADKTVIAISADHYPYGLSKEDIDQLAGHEVEKNFELYKSTFILWKQGMKPIIIDKPCSSLDIIPTLSNLFGLEFDSRLLMGRDILSDDPPLVIFSNWSWITDRAMFNSVTDTITFKDGTVEDKEYIASVGRMVANKFKYSAKILERDYYKKVIPQDYIDKGSKENQAQH